MIEREDLTEEIHNLLRGDGLRVGRGEALDLISKHIHELERDWLHVREYTQDKKAVRAKLKGIALAIDRITAALGEVKGSVDLFDEANPMDSSRQRFLQSLMNVRAKAAFFADPDNPLDIPLKDACAEVAYRLVSRACKHGPMTTDLSAYPEITSLMYRHLRGGEPLNLKKACLRIADAYRSRYDRAAI